MRKFLLRVILGFWVVFVLPKVSIAQKKHNEDFYNQRFCAQKNGVAEAKHLYNFKSGSSYIKIDCETATHVFEGGLDKRSSLDSVQQALFFAFLTGKKPAVVIFNRDGVVGKYEYRIQQACTMAGVEFFLVD